jgi:hypothetical protein
MIERPILFSGPLVRAILDGRKTQTRRILKPRAPEPIDRIRGQRQGTIDVGGCPVNVWHQFGADGQRAVYMLGSPYGYAGDRLWVRETWADGPDGPLYRAGPVTEACHDWPERWTPSIHMPRRASRLTLEVTGLRVQRLQEITNEDAIAEGAISFPLPDSLHASRGRVGWTFFPEDVGHGDRSLGSPRTAFGNAWNRIHGGPHWNTSGKPEPWEENPWVWCVSFRRLDGAGGAA